MCHDSRRECGEILLRYRRAFLFLQLEVIADLANVTVTLLDYMADDNITVFAYKDTLNSSDCGVYFPIDGYANVQYEAAEGYSRTLKTNKRTF